MEKTIYIEAYRALLRWLHDERKRRGLSLRDLGERLEVHHSRVGRIETGDRRLDVVEYVRLCEEIGCDAHYGVDMVSASERGRTLRRAAESRPIYRIPRRRQTANGGGAG